jgi:hypothetical protein
MASKTKTTDKTAEERTAISAMKELRARDASLAMREYQLEKLAVQARTERLRELRLSRDREAARDEPPAPVETKKKAAKKKA